MPTAVPNHQIRRWNVTAAGLLLVFCCLAWLMKDTITEHVPESYLGLFVACSIANAALFPSVSLLLIFPFAAVLPLHGVAFFAALGAALGEMTGYCLGFCGRDALNWKVTKRIQAIFSENEMLWVFILCILPLPIFDVIGILAG
ncbi:MAG: hypothetical protein IKY38_06110, partial [Anaerotignum sp.]|nr:hypothetical protein [Anaerotignum sp.]